MREKTDKPRGVLAAGNWAGGIAHNRYHPSADLASYVEHFWSVEWQLNDQPPKKIETVPHPSVHLVFEEKRSMMVGVHKGIFARVLEGEGAIFAIKFCPASFRGFYGKALTTITSKSLAPSLVFGPEICALENKVLAATTPQERLTHAEDFLRRRLPALDEHAVNLNRVLSLIAKDRALTQVAQLLPLAGCNLRQLQRLFNEYIGVSPKWVIARYRIHEALERVQDDEEINWAALALDLGYADQAHFIRDFKALIHTTPRRYKSTLKS